MRDHLIRVVVSVLLVGAVFWGVSSSEWVDEEVDRPAQGEAAQNELYAAQKLVQSLGAVVSTPHSLESLPPTGATLWLSSSDWNIFPEREVRLKQWVEQGGHLVAGPGVLNHRWLPWLEMVDKERLEEDSLLMPQENGEAHPEATKNQRGSSRRLIHAHTNSGPSCEPLTEPHDVISYYADGERHFMACELRTVWPEWTLAHPPLWALRTAQGRFTWMRMPMGRGSVTLMPTVQSFENEWILSGDHALILVAALQVRPGVPVWLVREESRPALLSWVWQRAWVVVVLTAVALGLGWWRGSTCFGPLESPPVRGRRSMAEQVRGTARFLQRFGGATLHVAQLRALDAVAAVHVRSYAQLDRTRRAEHIARMTGLDVRALALAMDRQIPRRPVDWPPVLELLEIARRLLAQSPTPHQRF